MNEESITTERFKQLIEESDVLQSETHITDTNRVEEILLQHPELGMITIILNDAENTNTLID
jgi:hypothetical protein